MMSEGPVSLPATEKFLRLKEIFSLLVLWVNQSYKGLFACTGKNGDGEHASSTYRTAGFQPSFMLCERHGTGGGRLQGEREDPTAALQGLGVILTPVTGAARIRMMLPDPEVHLHLNILARRTRVSRASLQSLQAPVPPFIATNLSMLGWNKRAKPPGRERLPPLASRAPISSREGTSGQVPR